MNNIRFYEAPKYEDRKYSKEKNNIYHVEGIYVTSLMFQQEPDKGEETIPSRISQYPLEDILDKFCVYVSDFYKDENQKSKTDCYLEFASSEMDCVKALTSIVGKHVYNKKDEKSGTVKLIIEKQK